MLYSHAADPNRASSTPLGRVPARFSRWSWSTRRWRSVPPPTGRPPSYTATGKHGNHVVGRTPRKRCPPRTTRCSCVHPHPCRRPRAPSTARSDSHGRPLTSPHLTSPHQRITFINNGRAQAMEPDHYLTTSLPTVLQDIYITSMKYSSLESRGHEDKGGCFSCYVDDGRPIGSMYRRVHEGVHFHRST